MSRILDTAAAAALVLVTACASAGTPEPAPTPTPDPAPAPAATTSPDAPAAGTIATPPALGTLRPWQLPPIEELRLDNGLRVVVVKQDAMPIVTASLLVDAGAEHEPLAKSGLASLTGSLLSEGTRSLSGPELAERMERLGAQLQTGSAYTMAFVLVTGLKATFPEALRLGATTLLEPTFPEPDFQRVRQQMLAGQRQQLSTVEGLADQAFIRAVFQPTSRYSRWTSGTPETLEAITRDDVVAWHRARFVPARTTLLFVGALDLAEARQLAESAFGGWQGSASPSTLPTAHLQPVPGTRVILVDRPGSVQSAIRIGQGTVGMEHGDFFRLTALAQVLGGGFSARINQNLRETHGWTYGAFANFGPMRNAGTLRIASSVRTNATDSALVESVREYRRLVQEAVPNDELQASLNNLVGSFPTSVMTVQGLASRMQTVIAYGLPLDYYGTYRERLAAVTTGDLTTAGSTHLTPDALTIVVAGDVATIEAPIRALGLGDVEVWSAEGKKLR